MLQTQLNYEELKLQREDKEGERGVKVILRKPEKQLQQPQMIHSKSKEEISEDLLFTMFVE